MTPAACARAYFCFRRKRSGIHFGPFSVHFNKHKGPMEKLLLVDADLRSARMVDIGLRKAGFRVWLASDGVDALAKVDALSPELVIADTNLPNLDGRGLVSSLRSRRETALIPVILLVSPESTERGRRFDVDAEDSIRKPVVLRELVARIRAVEARRMWRDLADETRPVPVHMSGSTTRLALVDLLRSFDLARRSGRVCLRSGSQESTMTFRDGRLVDAEFGRLRGEEAVYRALMLSDALFEIDFGPVTCEDVVHLSTDDILAEGLNRLEETLEARQEPVIRVSFRPPVIAAAQSESALRPSVGTVAIRAAAPPVREPVVVVPVPAVVRAPARIQDVPSSAAAVASQPETRAPEVALMVSPASTVAARATAHDAIEIPLRAPVKTPTREVTAEENRPEPVAPIPTQEATAQAEQPAYSPEAHGQDTVEEAPPPNAPTESFVHDAPSPGMGSFDVDWPTDNSSVHADRQSRTVPPLTIQTQDDEPHAAGVPRKISPLARGVVGGAVAIAAGLIIVAGLNSSRARQLREAEEAHSALTALAAAVPIPSVVMPVNLATATPSVAGVVPSAVAQVERPAPAELKAPTPRAHEGDAPLGTGNRADTTGALIAAPRAESVRSESALGMKFEETGQSPTVLEAERALARGATSSALELAQRAVAENPANADAWLTLGAAREASGDANSARFAYQSCVAQAHTVGLNHCRILAERGN